MELNDQLNRIAEHIVDSGTQDESRALEVLAAAASRLNPGAAAALVDWNGSEIARQRAFGMVHGLLLRELSWARQEDLLAGLLDIAPAPLPAETHAAAAAQSTRTHRFPRAIHPLNWSRIRA